MLGDDHVELHGFHDYVLARSLRRLDAWLARGFVRVEDDAEIRYAMFLAFDFTVPEAHYAEVWKRLFPHRPLQWWDSQSVLQELMRMACDPIPRLYVFERRIERGFRSESPKFVSRPLPPRTTTDHFVVVEAVTDAQLPTPVAGLRLELLIADGEVKSAQTDANGVARVERIQAGRVVIRVLDLDGSLWRPVEGEPSQPSSSGQRVRPHVVKQGECLARIARSYGLASWRKLWNAPENAPLRKRRKTPHVLHPGDPVMVPAVDVHEIVRPTDATHRIAIAAPPYHLAVVLRDFNGLAFAQEPYELWVPGEATARPGETDADGLALALLPSHATHVEVHCPRLGMHWHLALGALDPLDAGALVTPDGGSKACPENSSLSGLQARLRALGYAPGTTTDKWNERTERALVAFQTHERGAGQTEASTWTAESDDALRRRFGA